MNKERFWVEPQLSVQYLAMNTIAAPVQGQRHSCGRQSTGRSHRGALLEQGGFFAGVLTDQILPPGMPGSSA